MTLQAGLAPSAPDTVCKLAFAEIPGWSFQNDTSTRLTSAVPSTIKVTLRSPAGPKGFFRMPATVTYSGDGWTLSCRTALRTLTQNRLCQWAVSTGQGWQPATNVTVHGAMNLDALLGASPTGSTATAVAVLRVTRPTPLRFDFEGPIRLTIDGVRIGTDIQRGDWGNAALAPGDHVLKAVFTLKKSGDTLFKVACDTADTCLPGDLVVLPAEAVMSLQPDK